MKIRKILNIIILALCALTSLLCGIVGWALPAGLFGLAGGVRAITVYLTEVKQ